MAKYAQGIGAKGLPNKAFLAEFALPESRPLRVN
jgi:hypothetical protein